MILGKKRECCGSFSSFLGNGCSFRELYSLTLSRVKGLGDELGKKEVRVRKKEGVKKVKVTQPIEDLGNLGIEYTEAIQNSFGDFLIPFTFLLKSGK